MKSLIIMTTYNGEKYLGAQLESIIHQTERKWKLLIRDDGSTDGTIDILNEYRKKDDRIEVLHNTSEEHGAYRNFWYLITYAREKYSDYDFYFFSDQDDIWLPNKIKNMSSIGLTCNQKKPLLIYSDMEVINQCGDTVYSSLNSIMGIGQMSGLSLFFTHGFLYGCDMMLNNILFNTTPIIDSNHPLIDIVSHDNYFGKAALLSGEIQYVNQVLMKHRRHDTNTTKGYKMRITLFNSIKRALFRLDELSKIHAGVYNQSLVFLSTFGDYGMIKESIYKGGFFGARIMKKYGVKRKQFIRTIGIYVVMLLGKYKKYICFKWEI